MTSGMAAISATLMSLCNTGDHIVASNTIYGAQHCGLRATRFNQVIKDDGQTNDPLLWGICEVVAVAFVGCVICGREEA